MGSSDAESYIFFKQKDLSDELKIDKSEVCKALKVLMNITIPLLHFLTSKTIEENLIVQFI